MFRYRVVACLISVMLLVPVARAAGDAVRGARVFRACAACHSTVPGRNLTGPSLVGIWDRKAGSLASFDRYSPALKRSGVIWNGASLDAWLTNPAAFIPHNAMTFPGIKDASARADLIAYLKALSATGRPSPANQRADLKHAETRYVVTAIRYCRDTYRVTTADGETEAFWESNLRFKTDSSDLGPRPDAPVLLGAGMMGDRAFVVFAKPEEFGAFIKRGC